MISSPVHDVIDGMAPIENLSHVEREELRRMRSALRIAVEALGEVPAPDLTAAIMSAVQTASPRPAPTVTLTAKVHAWLRWLWTPRPVIVPLRPALIGAFAVLTFLAAGLGLDGPDGPVVAAGADDAPPIYVQFRIEASGASRVALAGSFSRWNPTFELQETSPGVWSATLPLPPGVHDYAFLVDDAWVADPHTLQVSDGFGGANNRIALPDPSAGALAL